MPKMLQEMNEDELTEFFTDLARLIESELPPGPSAKGKCLFCLVVIPTEEPGTAQYVANANRAGIIKVMRELANRLERRQDSPRDFNPRDN